MKRTSESLSQLGLSEQGTARLNERGELIPTAVDESLTSLLFASRPAAVAEEPPSVEPEVLEQSHAREPSTAERTTTVLFEMV